MTLVPILGPCRGGGGGGKLDLDDRKPVMRIGDVSSQGEAVRDVEERDAAVNAAGSEEG